MVTAMNVRKLTKIYILFNLTTKTSEDSIIYQRKCCLSRPQRHCYNIELICPCYELFLKYLTSFIHHKEKKLCKIKQKGTRRSLSKFYSA